MTKRAGTCATIFNTVLIISSALVAAFAWYGATQTSHNSKPRHVSPPRRVISLAGKTLSSLEGLKEIPRPDLVTHLDLSHNALSEISNIDLAGFINLEALDLSYNNLPIFSFKSIVHCPRLRYLNVAHNQLTAIKKTSPLQRCKLRYLDLSHNALSHFKPTALLQAKSLREFDISHNNLQTLHLKGPTKLTVVDVSHNRLTTLTPFFVDAYDRISYLDFSYNLIGRIPLLPGFSHLYALNLSNNRIWHIHPEAFSRVPTLALLWLSNNCLLSTENLEQLKQLKNLIWITLDGNNLMDLESLLELEQSHCEVATTQKAVLRAAQMHQNTPLDVKKLCEQHTRAHAAEP